MATIEIQKDYMISLEALNAEIKVLNDAKVKIIFEALGLRIDTADFELLKTWNLIELSVPDRTMAVQLNKLSAYVPNLKFVVDDSKPLFTLTQGLKQRRVWKER
ncbi:hypothetical protein EZL74_10740 [Flavobacterium silvisoli]|uniref:Uncharacterized protein n=1 Tax=Flavobacterium silvisoli TaxID=2529433 RepID=A0A4Q9YSR8_9FLAO|nr:hypothetical protein [Flavobacterium silvisoli]TBX66651.1 hypothetical protein EZL74_10740 [Flavobacterium silvisoli]